MNYTPTDGFHNPPACGKILVVDDDRVTLDSLRTRLRLHGYDIGMCQDGAQALDMIKQGGWDLVVLDLGLPSPDPERVALFDGLKVLKWLKILHQSVPVLIFTSNQNPEMPKLTTAAGAIGLVRKGDPIGLFLEAVRRGVSLHYARSSGPEPEARPRCSAQRAAPLVWKDHSDSLTAS